MDRFAELEAFAATIELGSQAAAATSLGLSRMAVSRLIRALEERIGEPLLIRTTRSQILTEAGARVRDTARAVLDHYRDLLVRPGDDTREVAGTLRVSVPVSFGWRQIVPRLPELMATHQRLRVDVVLLDRQVHLIDEGFDIAVRIGDQPAAEFAATRLGLIETVLCATPAYIDRHGAPKRPTDLMTHDCLLYAYASPGRGWVFRGPGGAEQRVRVTGRLTSNNGDALLAAALAGLGIIQQPRFVVEDDLKAGRLVPLLRGYRTRELAAWAIEVPGRERNSAADAFIGFLARRVFQTAP
ncbi:LysR family transcriptional regulator [Phreatobacter sp.]|uniref:LysR family transcriptional regulator n=1 Tax=Phreatobacter sp. TaxID=1966341 RepID=UPI0025E4B679|nr:LysR family transcriptional regulator [Phreatobacter sp.]